MTNKETFIAATGGFRLESVAQFKPRFDGLNSGSNQGSTVSRAIDGCVNSRISCSTATTLKTIRMPDEVTTHDLPAL